MKDPQIPLERRRGVLVISRILLSLLLMGSPVLPLCAQEVSAIDLSYQEQAQRAVLKEPFHWNSFGQYFPSCHVIAERRGFSSDSALPSLFGLKGGCCEHTLNDEFLFEKLKLLYEEQKGSSSSSSSYDEPAVGSGERGRAKACLSNVR